MNKFNRKEVIVMMSLLGMPSAWSASLPVAEVLASDEKHEEDTLMTYTVEMSGNVSSGSYAPLWFTANRQGLASQRDASGYLLAGVHYKQALNKGWRLGGGLSVAGAADAPYSFQVHEAYADVAWKCLNLSIGAKERFPLGKNPELSSGAMVEGMNARPVPQVRAEIADYFVVPDTKGWFAFKGHVAYGRFVDDEWQKDFCRDRRQSYLEDVLYHSKQLMLRFGNKEKFPIEAELGLLMAAQFGGKRHEFSADGTEHVTAMPTGVKNYFKVFAAQAGGDGTTGGDQVNVEGNHVGSWNFGINYYPGEWKVRAYMEHFFDDHSQMFIQYGRWKDGHLGIEVTLPQNRWVETVLWEGLCTKDQSGPILYDGDDRFLGAIYPGVQVSAKDEYYNNFFYQSWQHEGQGMGNPLLPGPLYNNNGSLRYRSNRVRAHHWALCGQPSPQWRYRVLMSYALHWGTYGNPLDRIKKQFSSIYEVSYQPAWCKGWTIKAALGHDAGNYIGNSVGGMLTIGKEGICF